MSAARANTISHSAHAVVLATGGYGNVFFLSTNAKFSNTDTTILFQDGFYVGQSFVCGHVRVVIVSDGKRIEFYGQDGESLRSIQVAPPFATQREAA